MDPHQWHAHQQELEDELACMYQQEEQPRMLAQSLPEQQQQQYYTSPPAMAPPNNPFYPSPSSLSSTFPSFGGHPLPTPSFGAVAVNNDDEPGQSYLSSNIFSFGGQPPRTLSFSVGDDWSHAIEAVQPVPERRSRAHLNTQEHVIAERRRREKMQQQFAALATIVPDLTKTDKISILGSTVEYVKQLEEKVRALEEQSARRSSDPIVFERKCRISRDNNDASWPDGSVSSGPTSGYTPSVEASIHGDTMLLKICCKERKGVLVMVFSEVEKQGLSIINTSVVPFTDSCHSITITVKVGQGFPTTAELINNLTRALRGFT